MQRTETTRTEGAIWNRVLDPDGPSFSRAAAQAILDLEFPQQDRDRMHELAAKARAGTLTAEEQQEVESYSRVGSILGIMKSKARISLRKTSKSNGKGR